MQRIEVESHDFEFFKMLVREEIAKGYVIDGEVIKEYDNLGNVISYKQQLVRL